MQKIINTTKQIGLLTIALTVAFGANLAYGQWTNPTAVPPANNAETPINTSATNQIKTGSLGVDELIAAGQIRSDQYCAFDGTNCFNAAAAATLVNSGGGNSSAFTYHTFGDYLRIGGYNCSCAAGDLLTGCSGFQRSDRTTQAVNNGSRDYCRNEGTNQRPMCSCLRL